jgi:hypothetical protein
MPVSAQSMMEVRDAIQQGRQADIKKAITSAQINVRNHGLPDDVIVVNMPPDFFYRHGDQPSSLAVSLGLKMMYDQLEAGFHYLFGLGTSNQLTPQGIRTIVEQRVPESLNAYLQTNRPVDLSRYPFVDRIVGRVGLPSPEGRIIGHDNAVQEHHGIICIPKTDKGHKVDFGNAVYYAIQHDTRVDGTPVTLAQYIPEVNVPGIDMLPEEVRPLGKTAFVTAIEESFDPDEPGHAVYTIMGERDPDEEQVFEQYRQKASQSTPQDPRIVDSQEP